jgi:hypothetical protein
MRALNRILLCLSPVVLAACGFDFESKGILLDRRILAMQADPPEIIIGVSDLSKPVQFKALVADPKNPVEPQAFEWRWCIPTFATSGFYDPVASRCTETDETPVEKGAATLSNLTFDVSPNAVIAVLQNKLGGGGQGGSGTGGSGSPNPNLFKDVQGSVLLAAQLKVADDSETPLYGIKRIALSTPLPNNQPPNSNPRLAAVLFDGKPWEPGTPLALKVNDCSNDKKVEVVDVDGPKNARGQRPTVTVCEHRITPVFDDAQTETYQAATFDRDADGNPVLETVKERLRFDWTITDNGTLSSNSSEQPQSIGPKEYDPISVKWREPPRLKGSSVQLWVVVRDGRGGESWESRMLELVE